MKSLPSITMDKKATQWFQFLAITFICLAPNIRLLAQTGPFYPTNWPPTIDTNSTGVDYLIVDLPPGTGDVVISLVQTVPITGAVVVLIVTSASPYDVSLQNVPGGPHVVPAVSGLLTDAAFKAADRGEVVVVGGCGPMYNEPGMVVVW